MFLTIFNIFVRKVYACTDDTDCKDAPPAGCWGTSHFCDKSVMPWICKYTYECSSACPSWGDWGDCIDQGNDKCAETRFCPDYSLYQIRECTCPVPACNPGGTSCGTCSALCGPGTQSCTDGCDTWDQACNNGPCCTPVNGSWGIVSACSKSCGGGTQTKTCSAPVCGGSECTREAGALEGEGTLTTPDNRIETLNCNTQVCGPWWQVKDGDVQTNGNLNSAVADGLYFNLSGLGGFPGVAKYGTSTTLSATKVSAKGWLANSAYSSPNGFQNYTYFRRMVPSETTVNTVSGTTLVLNGVESADGYYWYEYDGALTGGLPLTISSAINLASGVKVILLVTGADLNIEKSINFTSGQSIFVALVDGSININPAVGGGSPDLQGFFLADNNYSTGVSANPLYIKGSVVALSGFNLQRDLIGLNETTPSEVFEYDPIDIFLFPPKLSIEKTRWKEVAP